MDSETRCNGYKIIERCNLFIPHYSYSGDLPLEIIISDLKYIISLFEKYNYLKHNLEEILDKLKDPNYNCRFKELNIEHWIDDEIIFKVLPLIDYINKKIIKIQFISNLIYELKNYLDIEIRYPSVKNPVNNSS